VNEPGRTTTVSEPLLVVDRLKKYFPIYRGTILHRHVADVRAVDEISFNIQRGETLGLVGESGCGKSTAGRTILQLYRPTSGEVTLANQRLTELKGESLRLMRRRMQIIFQDPFASLNPQMTVEQIVGTPLVVHGLARGGELRDQVHAMLDTVGLNPSFARRLPHEFSGGQRQRIGIARALILRPDFVVCDEPISALDVSIRAQIINLLQDLQQTRQLTYLFIAHDLAAVRHVSDRIAVMYLGKIVELAQREALYRQPLHPYTKALLSAVPVADPIKERQRERIILTGETPSPINPPSGCRFHTRCPISRRGLCDVEAPIWREAEPDHWVACHLA